MELFRFFGGRLFVFLDSRRMWLESRWRIIETAVLSDRFISSVPASQETNFSWLATSEGINVGLFLKFVYAIEIKTSGYK